MTKLVVTTILLFLVVPPAFGESGCSPNIAGETQHWAIAVCQVRSETDDFENPAVQQCIGELITKDKIDMKGPPNCMLNEKYKKEWCAFFVEFGNEPSLSACMKSTTSIPRVVRNGGA